MANYNRLAKLQGKFEELALFRAFPALNMKNLQSMQAELLHLERELEHIEEEDKRSGEKSRSTLHKSFHALKASSSQADNIQWQKRLEIRELLRAYSTSGRPRIL